ncbi:MAG: hypothetical protein ACI4UY_07775 [Kiritimatiellia bacterium]
MFEDRYVCTQCGASMRSPKKVSGMGCWVTALLFVLFVLTLVTFMWILSLIILIADAIIYYATLKKNCCPKCKGKECVIPINSPLGQKLMRELSTGRDPSPSVADAKSKTGEEKIVYDPETHQYVKR